MEKHLPCGPSSGFRSVTSVVVPWQRRGGGPPSRWWLTMSNRFVRLSFALALGATACSKSGNPAEPSAAATPVSGAEALTASIAAPRPLAPGNNVQIRNVDQPVTLVVRNAVSTKSGVTYTFEVATDSAFAAKVQTKDAVVEGTNGQTTVRLDALAPSTDYYWHARATSRGTTGVFGARYKFTVGPAITINPPVPIAPLTGTRTSTRPALRVANATRTGPAGAITYRFEIAPTSTFSSLIAVGTNTEGINETAFVPTTDLPVDTMFFWRATAMDVANGVTSAPSAVQSFTTSQPSAASLIAAQLGVTLWPGAQPPGSNGHAAMGHTWNVDYLTSFDGVRFLSPRLEVLQTFDLLDRGFDPQGAIDWMNSHGYPTRAVYYPAVLSIGFTYEYLALVNGQWDLVLRVGA